MHFFWGKFGLAVTRFSWPQRRARHPAACQVISPSQVAAECTCSHEVSSAGFWPGSPGPVDYPAFYSYAYPAPQGFADATVTPGAAFFSKELGEFILPCSSAVQQPRGPSDATLMGLPWKTAPGEAAADLAEWDRQALECPLGEPGKVRPI